MDQARIQRLLRLMRLLSGSINYTIEELAKKLETSQRTIYRYIESLKAAGFVVEKLWANTYKLERKPEIVPEFENLMYFSEEECYVIYQMIDSMVPINSMRKAIKEKLSVIYESTGIEHFESKTCNSAHIRALKMAARDKKKVILRDYESGNSHTIRDRLVEPFGFTAEFIDVFAYDLEAGQNKIFKIPRIGTVDILEDNWSAECHHKKPGMDIFRMTGNYIGHVRWKMSSMAKNLLVEEFPMAERYLQYHGGPWILDTKICNYAGACRFYVGLMHEIEVIESEEFMAYVKEYIQKQITIPI